MGLKQRCSPGEEGTRHPKAAASPHAPRFHHSSFLASQLALAVHSPQVL